MIKSLDKQKIQAHNKEQKIEKYIQDQMIKSLHKQKIQALNKEKIKTDTKCQRRQFRHHTGTTWVTGSS